MEPQCATCGAPATCYGTYEGQPPSYSCDTCCGHGNEDGWCEPVGAEFNYERLTHSAGEAQS